MLTAMSTFHVRLNLVRIQSASDANSEGVSHFCKCRAKPAMHRGIAVSTAASIRMQATIMSTLLPTMQGFHASWRA
jgi:hypothetical protein